jgi:hypothetical protein
VIGRHARLLLAGGLAFASLAAGCLFGPDDSTERRSLAFTTLRFATPIAAYEDSVEIEVGYLVGTNSCWGVERIGIDRSGNTIHVSGTAVFRQGDWDCADVVHFARSTLFLPPVEPGSYLLRACSLTDTVRVLDQPAEATQRAVLKGRVYREEGSCGSIDSPPGRVGLSALPDSIPGGALIVWADELGSDPCGLDFPEMYAFFASVRRLITAPT